MSYQLQAYAGMGLNEEVLESLIDEHESTTQPRLARLWRYYRNWLSEPTFAGGSVSAPAQKAGLPPRLTEVFQLLRDDRYQRDIVVENDIMWRIHTLIDFMLPEPPTILSCARDQRTQEVVEAVLNAVIHANGGPLLWQTAALLGSVYGHVDLLLRIDPIRLERLRSTKCEVQEGSASGGAWSKPFVNALAEASAATFTIETIEAPRAFPILALDDFRTLDGYVLHFDRPNRGGQRRPILGESGQFTGIPSLPTASNRTIVTELHTAESWQRYENRILVGEGRNELGLLPVIHIQNLPQPFHYTGLSDVESLIPLQDELNTRLSDRANRVTMQSFKMWLGKGIDGFTDRPVGPGQMWVTDNPDASIESFGGDAESPSEESHIRELREAMDRASGVTPAAAGHIQSRVGNLSSENAMRISLLGTINRVKRKREHFGHGIAQLCELILQGLDRCGALPVSPADRLVDVRWTDALAIDESRKLADAQRKADLGIAKAILHRELGYSESEHADSQTGQ